LFWAELFFIPTLLSFSKVKFLRIDHMDSCIDSMLKDAGHEVYVETPHNETEFLDRMQGMEGLIIRSRFVINEQILSRLPELKVIGRAGSGLENIDLEAAQRYGVRVLNSPEGNRDAVGEHCLALLLGLLRKIPTANTAIANGTWDRIKFTGEDLKGKTIGIVGFGNTGSAFARRLQGFNLRVLAYDKYKSGPFSYGAEEVTFDRLVAESDVISFHLPLAPDTRHVFSTEMVAQFTRPVYIINTSRGQVVDSQMLISALASGKVAGAGLDVLESESHNYLVENREDSIIQQLAAFPNVILTPHVAGITPASLKGIAEVLACKLLDLPLPKAYL
jgi:D-3-phosphoglycerate dehydrogenase / 2-oxoglutarate reductase